jgi:hypothetical protein
VPSLSTIFRQIEREGARWGLVPVMRGDRVAVAQLVPELQGAAGSLVVPVMGHQVITSLGEDAPMDAFSAILRSRVTRHARAFAAVCAEQRKARQALLQRGLDEERADIKAHYKRRLLAPRIWSMPGLAR